MRLDHIAYRTKNKLATAEFFIKAFGYKIQQEFTLDFGEGKTAQCIALEPPEKLSANAPWTSCDPTNSTIYHLAPEIFVSDGSPGSIVGDWVNAHNGIGGIHHLAYMVDDVEATIKEWQEKGYAEFSSGAIKCPGLTQVFSRPSNITGVVYEFIKREGFGFCKENVLKLMQSAQNVPG